MPLNQNRRLDTRDKIILEKAKWRPNHHPHEFLQQQFRSFRGEPPAVAGFLLYPDSPAKMETTTQEAFCCKPIPLQDRDKGQKTIQNGNQHHNVFSREEKTVGRRGLKTGEAEISDNRSDSSARDRPNEDSVDMKSQYQKDFPPPTSCRRKRTPAFPQPDNIGINPAFRIDFSTMQRENFPCWPVGSPLSRHKPSGR